MADNQLLVVRFVEELWNERKLELADVLFDDKCQTNQLRSGPPNVPMPRGPAAIKMHVADWLSGFPDLRVTIEQMFAAGDRVFSQLSMDGTQTGQWLGIPPTGKRVNIRMVRVHRFESRKIVEDWVLVESLGFFQQLGALPATTVLCRDRHVDINAAQASPTHRVRWPSSSPTSGARSMTSVGC